MQKDSATEIFIGRQSKEKKSHLCFQRILLIYYCVANYQKNLVAENNLKNLLSHAMFVGQEFGWFWPWVSWEAAVMVSAKATGILRFDWGQRPCAYVVSFSRLAVWLMLAVVGALCSFWYRPLHREIEDPHNMGASSPQTERSKRDQGKSGNAFYELALQATPHHFCCVYCLWRPSLIPCGRGLHKEGVDTRNENHWRPSWKLGITYGEDFNKRSTPQRSFVLWFWENRAALDLLVLNFLFACRECALCLFHPRWH